MNELMYQRTTSSDDEDEDCPWSVRQCSVLNSNRHMFDRQLACDVHFVVQGYGDAHAVTVGAHRYVLLSRSPVFYRMFCAAADEPWEDKDDEEQTLEQDADDETEAYRQEEIRIDDMPSEAFKQLLGFLYYEEASLTDENVMYVMYAARKYRVSPLIDLCQQHVDKAMSDHRVLGMLRQSLTFADEGLRDRCLSLIRSSTNDVLCNQQFVDVSEDVLAMIVDQPQLSVLEVDLFRACVDWATRQLRRDDSDAVTDGPAMRRTLQNILPRIRFPTMSLDQFSTVVVPLGILTTDETCELYKYLTCPVKPETRFSRVCRCVNISTYVVTLSTQYKLKTVLRGGPQTLQCYGNVNKPIRLYELRFIAHEVVAGSRMAVEVHLVNLEQDGRATELSFSSETKRAESFDQEVFRTSTVSLKKTKNAAIPWKKSSRHRQITTDPFQKLSPVLSAVDTDEVCQLEYYEEPKVETKRVNAKSDMWTWSTLKTSKDGKIYKVVHVRWDGEDLLLDEGDFTLSYGFNVTTTAAGNEDVTVDIDDAVTSGADTKLRPFDTLPVVTAWSAPLSNQLLYIRRLDHKRFDSNDVAFTLNFPSGPLMAFAFYRL